MIEKSGGDTVWEVASREGEKSERRGGRDWKEREIGEERESSQSKDKKRH